MKKTAAILLIICACVLLVACGSTYNRYPDGRAYNAGECVISGSVESIELNWVAGKVNIEYTNGDEISLSEQADRNLSKEHKLHWRLDGKKLIIQFAASGSRYPGNLNKELTVLLPESLRLTDLTVNSVSAVVDAQGVCTENLRINSVSGNVKLAEAQVRSVEFDTVSGNMEIAANETPERIDGDSVSGSVTICLPADAGFAADVDSVSGRVTGPEGMTGNSKTGYAYGDEQCRISINTVSGGVHLKHAK